MMRSLFTIHLKNGDKRENKIERAYDGNSSHGRWIQYEKER